MPGFDIFVNPSRALFRASVLRERRYRSAYTRSRPISSWLSTDKQPTVVRPLAERPATHLEDPRNILSWYQQAVAEAKLAAPKFREADDPTCEYLLTELNWLLEDAVGPNWRSYSLQDPSTLQEAPWQVRASKQELEKLWNRRLRAREPLQYLTNSSHWRDFVVAVGPGVLIPRGETACLIDFAMEASGADDSLGRGIWADLGTGSGALSIGLALTFPALQEWRLGAFASAIRLRRFSPLDMITVTGIQDANPFFAGSQIYAVDASHAACAWASFNAQRLYTWARSEASNVQGVIKVQQGSWFKPLEHLKGQLTGILSNPPYIERQVLPTLQAEVRRHEPMSALDGGNGLDCLREICASAGEYLRPGGFIGLETGGPHQTDAVGRLLFEKFHDIRSRKDMFGVERFVTATRR